MKYQDSAEALQAAADWSEGDSGAAKRLAEANINPATGLATDYLNHFNEAIMLLEMLSSCPDCIEDFLAWQPLSYREHFCESRFKDRQLAIAAYEAADPAVRRCLDSLTGTMTAVLESTRTAMHADLPSDLAAMLAEHAVQSLKPLVARAGAVINGEADSADIDLPQAAVDLLLKQ